MVSFILDILLDTFLARYFCPLTLTVYDNLYQCSWFDNCVITDIEVANIVFDMDNLLISWWLMHRGKHATSCEPTICVVWKTCDCGFRQQTFCVMWKTCDSVVFVNRHFVWCGKHATSCDTSTDILCGVENMRLCVIRQQTFCVMWKSYWTVYGVENLLHRLYRGKLTDKIRFENMILISSWLMYRGKLTHIIVINVPRKTYSHHPD